MRRLAERGEFDPEDKEEAVTSRLALVKAGQRFEGERARRDGRIFAYTFNPLPEGGGVLTFSDVTEARKREARLARSEEAFRYRFRNLPLPVWTYSSRTLKFLDVNDAAIAVYGYTREEFLSMSAIEMCGPEGAERLSKWLAEGRSSAFEPSEWYNRCKDGRLLQVESYGRDIDFDGEPARVTVVIDVTARKEAERLNQRLVETSQDLVFVTDGYAKLLLVSPSVTRMLGVVSRGDDRPQHGGCHRAGRSGSGPTGIQAGAARPAGLQLQIAPPAQGRPTSSRCSGWACGLKPITATTWSAAT